MPKPMCRDSSWSTRLHTSASTGSLALSPIILKSATAKVSALRFGRSRPERRAVDVDQLVGDDAAVGRGGLLPGDVLRGVPLVALGVLVEPAEVHLGRAVVVLEHRGHRGRNRPRLHTRLQGKPMSF